MAVRNALSTTVTNFDANPRVLTSGYIAGANDTVCVATVATLATDNIGSTYRYGFLPSGARVQDIELMNDATTAGIWKLGVYNNDQQAFTSSTGGVVTTSAPSAISLANSDTILGSGISTAAANPNWKSVFSPSILAAGFLAANALLRVWELLGLDFDPFYEFHLTLSATTAPTAVGTIALQYTWVR